MALSTRDDSASSSSGSEVESSESKMNTASPLSSIICMDSLAINRMLRQTGIYEILRTPSQVYQNANQQNGSQLLDAMWLQIFRFLDTNSLLLAMIACKNFTHIANDIHIRSQFYSEKQAKSLRLLFREFEEIQMPLLQQPVLAHIPDLAPQLPMPIVSLPLLFQKSIKLENIAIIPNNNEVHNPNPPGQGFVMRRQ